MGTFFSAALGVFIVLGLGLGFHAHAAAGGKHLFILSGQSNMAGLDPHLSFTPAIEKEFGKANVIIIKDAQGGQPIRRWYKKWKPATGKAPQKTGDLYDRLMAKVTPAIKGQEIKTVTFIWMQGEKDAREKHGEVYAASLTGLVAQLSADLGRKDINFVNGRLSDYGMANAKYPHWIIIREAQVAVAKTNSRYAWVDTDDLNGKKNRLHYEKHAGYKILGQRFADKAIALIRRP